LSIFKEHRKTGSPEFTIPRKHPITPPPPACKKLILSIKEEMYLVFGHFTSTDYIHQ